MYLARASSPSPAIFIPTADRMLVTRMSATHQKDMTKGAQMCHESDTHGKAPKAFMALTFRVDVFTLVNTIQANLSPSAGLPLWSLRMSHTPFALHRTKACPGTSAHEADNNLHTLAPPHRHNNKKASAHRRMPQKTPSRLRRQNYKAYKRIAGQHVLESKRFLIDAARGAGRSQSSQD